MSWPATSVRHGELPPDWPRIRRALKSRAKGICEHLSERGVRCKMFGSEAHHAGDRASFALADLLWLCKRHHGIVTARQGNEAQAAIKARGKRPVAPHPGRQATRQEDAQ